MSEMATNTSKTFLMNSTTGSTYTKLVDIKETPDLGKAPEGLDATTLSDTMKVYVSDIDDPGGTLEFTANYDPTDYATLQQHVGKEENFAIWLGGSESAGVITPTGDLGKFEFKATLSVWLKSASVSAVREMGIGLTPTTKITFKNGSGD